MDPIFLAANRALGIFNKLVTGPLFRLIEGDGHIFKLNVIWSKLYDYLVESGKDASSMLEGKTFYEDNYTGCAKKKTPSIFDVAPNTNASHLKFCTVIIYSI